ncbi:unnamed protein product [Adineta ricciae]|uniref:ETS domain-containing protein n=1 Tax=Adineta ricciae TaxID=249248 RepID=A0A815B508_ADIRI|nr:unnamed protein product [Adineta ricciae]CAF1267358.1 unnamed protein product [Adineta ricciae]
MYPATRSSDSDSSWNDILGSSLSSTESRKLGDVNFLISQVGTYYSREGSIFDPEYYDPEVARIIEECIRPNQSNHLPSNYTQNTPNGYSAPPRVFDHETIDGICASVFDDSQQSSSYHGYDNNYMASSFDTYPTTTNQQYLYTTHNSMLNYPEQNYSYIEYQAPPNTYYQPVVDNNVVLVTEPYRQSNPSIRYETNNNDSDLFNVDLGLSEVTYFNTDMQIDSVPYASVSKEPTSKSDSISGFNLDEWLIVSKTDGKKHRPHLCEFLRILLDNPKYSHVAQYTDRKKGIFKFLERHEAAKLWQDVKGRNCNTKMTYLNLARGIRFYYPSGTMSSAEGRYTFRFGPGSRSKRSKVPANH